MSGLNLPGSGARSSYIEGGKSAPAPYGQAPAHLTHTVRKPKGAILITGPAGVEDEGETLQCVHCQMHWRVQPGSGRQRGFCLNCAGPTCGKKACETRCVPAEKMIEEMEARSRLDAALERTKRL